LCHHFSAFFPASLPPFAAASSLTFLAPEKSKRNSTFHENCPAALHPEWSAEVLHRNGKRSAAEQKTVIIPKV
jgi:hypothetical protein